MAHYDSIVIGIGGMGSAASYYLARSGQTVLGIERHSLGHDQGASHGHTRLIRKAYFESPHYIPLLERSYELWSELERISGRRLLEQIGLVMMGRESNAPAMMGALESAAQYGIEVERLGPEELKRRHPYFSPPSGTVGVWEPGAGFLWVERAVMALAQLAKNHGVTIRERCQVISWKARPGLVEVVTDSGTDSANALVITAGPWSSGLLSDMGLPLTIHRVVQSWYASHLENIPCFAFDEPPHFLYGFPAVSGFGLKAALHSPGLQLKCPEEIDRNISDEDTRPVSLLLEARVRGISGPPISATTCFYTMTPDCHFVIDRHRDNSNVIFAAGFSGHGFKFVPVVGEILAELVSDGRTRQDIGFLRCRWGCGLGP